MKKIEVKTVLQTIVYFLGYMKKQSELCILLEISYVFRKKTMYLERNIKTFSW